MAERSYTSAPSGADTYAHSEPVLGFSSAMPSASPQHGSVFADDLRAIREARSVSLEEIHDQSKIPMDLLEGFERDALFSHSSYNLVYLRSLMRTYVEPLELDEAVALGALEAAWEGQYNRELAVEYLGMAAPSAPPPPAEEPAPSAAKKPAAPASKTRATKPPPTPAHKRGNPDAAKPDVTRQAATTRKTATAPAPRARAYEDRPDRKPWLLAALGVLGLVLVGWAVTSFFTGGDDAPDEQPPEEVAVAETDTAAAPPAPPAPTRPAAVLGSPMQVVITAKPSSDGLQEIRVKVDEEIRRPYWIEPGESETFTPQDRITIINDLDDATITLDGFAYPTDRLDAEGRIVIDRASGQAHLDVVSVR